MKKIYSPSIYLILLPIYSFLITFYSIFWDPKKGSVIDFYFDFFTPFNNYRNYICSNLQIY